MGSHTYTFSDDALCALSGLLDLVHYDGLAVTFFLYLPEDLREDMLKKAWLNDTGTEGDDDVYP